MRGLLRLGVFIGLGLFAACATTNDPASNDAADAAADAKAKDGAASDAAGNADASGDDATVDEDANVDEDAGDTDAAVVDAGKDTAVADTAVADTAVADTSVVDADDGGTADADDGSVADADVDADDGAVADAGGDVDVADADDGAVVDSGPAGCNDLAYGSAVLTIQDDPIATPAATGGTVSDGTYNLSTYTHYTGVGGSSGAGTLTLRSTVRITGNKIDILRRDYTNVEKRWSGTFVTSGTTITINYTCPAASSESGGYSAAPSKFAYYPLAGYETVHTK